MGEERDRRYQEKGEEREMRHQERGDERDKRHQEKGEETDRRYQEKGVLKERRHHDKERRPDQAKGDPGLLASDMARLSLAASVSAVAEIVATEVPFKLFFSRIFYAISYQT